jgi:hypothetical protein
MQAFFDVEAGHCGVHRPVVRSLIDDPLGQRPIITLMAGEVRAASSTKESRCGQADASAQNERESDSRPWAMSSGQRSVRPIRTG